MAAQWRDSAAKLLERQLAQVAPVTDKRCRDQARLVSLSLGAGPAHRLGPLTHSRQKQACAVEPHSSAGPAVRG
jgi:hypothetical protein